MAVPNFQSMMLPILRLASQQGTLRTSEAVAKISDEFDLSENERQEILPSGKQTRVTNRVCWARHYLVKAGLLQRESRGIHTITGEGRQALAENPPRIDIPFLLARSENFRQYMGIMDKDAMGNTNELDSKDTRSVSTLADVETPEERMENAFAELNAALQSDIYERVLAMHDADFERLIVKLMRGLGYGEAGFGKRTGGAGDGGIDGIITEDILGLDVIYLQAKRYNLNTPIGADKIREFAGYMLVHSINKGVFVTTSRYTKAALEYADRSPMRLRLIDGNELARLMVQHGVGVREDRKLELKRIDTDFFEEIGE